MGLFRREPYSEKHSSAGRSWGFNRIYGARDAGDRELYMTRAWIGRLRFHLFHRGDNDPDCHDHPWGFWTFPLRSYVEEVLVECERHVVVFGMDDEVETYFEREIRVVEAFRWHYRPATYRHRVIGPWTGRWEVFRPGFGHDVVTHKRPSDNGGKPEIGTGVIPTIVWREAAVRAWGFTKERNGVWCWVPWKTYVYEGGKDGPCE